MNQLAVHWSAVRQALIDERARKMTEWQEPDFLPAALEVIERPVSPTARLTAKLMMAGVVATMAWLVLGKVDIVASAPGVLMPIENIKVVQAPYGGTVKQIYVRDGDTVRRGQTLVALDPTMANADQSEAAKALLAAEMDIARNQAILDGLSGGTGKYTPPANISPEVEAIQRRLVATALAEHHAQNMGLEAARQSALADAQAAAETVRAYNATAPLLNKQVGAIEELAKKGYASKFRLLEIQRQHLSEKGNRDVAMAQLARGRSESSRYAQAIAESNEQARQTVLKELAAAQNDASVKREALIKSQQQRKMQTLVAPVDGTVQQLAVHTVGGVVESARPLMVVVPTGALTVEAKLSNRDAGFVRAGQHVAVKVDAYPFTRYGTVPGTILSLSRDAVSDGDKPAFYIARIALNRQYIENDGKRMMLRSGLNVTADVATGRRRLISYLLDPVTGGLSDAAREQ